MVSEGDCIGGLVGENWSGKIRESFSSGTVTGYDYTGGLVGSNSDEITACYSTCTVNGNSDVGGLVGGNTGPISYSFAVGAVNGNSKIGGLVGSNTGGTDIGCYWDTETSGQSTSACGTGQSTANMKKQETFIGWDFDDVWGINGSDNNGYPFLRWQSCTQPRPPLPAAPQNFTATPGDGQVALSWTAPAERRRQRDYQISKCTKDDAMQTGRMWDRIHPIPLPA
ncbi:MAG: GLUG motif-containing protein [Tepidanaerobacteraceae bacterium]